MSENNSTMERLIDQIEWYDKKSSFNQRCFKSLKVAEIIAAAIIPFAASFSICAFFTGGLGVLIVVLEGLQSINQFHHNWITYRSSCEELKHEKHLYLAKAGPYIDTTKADVMLAERVESLISREHAKWVSTRKQTEKESKDSEKKEGKYEDNTRSKS